MIIKEQKINNADASAHNDDSDLHQDEIGENTGDDTGLAKAIADEKNIANAEDSSPKKEDL